MHRRALHVCNVRRHCARPYSHLTRLTQHIGIAQQFVLQLLEAPIEMQGGFTWIVLALLLTSLNMSLAQGVGDSQSLAKSDVEAAQVLFDDTLEARDTLVNSTRGNLIEQYQEGPKSDFIVKGSEAEIQMVYRGILVENDEDVKSEVKSIVNEEYTDAMIQDIKGKLYEDSSAVTTEVTVEVKEKGLVDEEEDHDDGASGTYTSTSAAIGQMSAVRVWSAAFAVRILVQ